MASPNPPLVGDASPLHIHAFGWRGVPHSIALVHQWQMLSMLRMPGLTLTCADLDYASRDWVPRTDIFSPEQTARIAGVPPLGDGTEADVDLHVPLRLAQYRASGRPTVAFLPAEIRGRAVLASYEPVATMNARRELLYFAASNWVRNSFVEQGLDAGRIIVVGHGVDNSLYRPDAVRRAIARQQLRLDRFTFLHVGGMFGVKGIDILLKAFVGVLRHGIPARLVLKGTDGIYSSKAHVIEAIKQFSPPDRDLLTANLTYVGRPMSMLDMAALYNAADCYVSAYRAEGFGMPVLEAVASGLPVICTGGGSTDDFTTDAFRRKIRSDLEADDEAVLLAPRADDLAGKMADMVSDTAFRHQAAQAGPVYVAENATWDQVTAKLVRVLRGWRDDIVIDPDAG